MERDRVVVTDDHPLFAGQHGTITGQPSLNTAVVALDEGTRKRILITQLQLEPFKPPNLVTEPKSKSDELPLTGTSSVNTAAVSQNQPDVVAVEIAIGIRHLTPEQLAWVISSAASNGLSDSHLSAVMKAVERVFNERHHSECFKDKS